MDSSATRTVLSCVSCYAALLIGTLDIVLVNYYLLNANAINDIYDYLPREYVQTYIKLPLLMYRILFNTMPPFIITIYCYRIACSSRKRARCGSYYKGTYVLMVLSNIALGILALFDTGICFYKTLQSNKISVIYTLSHWIGLTENIILPIQLSFQ